MRIDKFLANMGVGTRTEVKQLLNIQRKLYERVKQLNKDDK